MHLKSLVWTLISSCLLLTACQSNAARQTDEDNNHPKDISQAVSGKGAADTVDQLTILRNLLNTKKGRGGINPELEDEGHAVKLTDAVACIKLFKPAMKTHAITDTAKAANLLIKRSRMITELEEFQGANLIEWLLATVKKYDPKGMGKNMGIRLKFGIYKDEFLVKYLPGNSSLRSKKKDRITIFLVPYFYGPNSITEISSTDTSATAYELGGLQP